MATKTSSRPRLSFLIAAAFALSATVMPTKVKAANYFYDNQGVSSDISDVNNWFLDSTLAAPAITAPSSSDGLFLGFSVAPFPGSNALYNDSLSGGVFASLNFSDVPGFVNYLVGGNSLTVGSISSTSGSYSAAINTSSLTLTGASTITAGAGSSISILPSVAGSSLTVAGSGSTALNGGISLGAGGLTKQGSGQLVVNGTANYTGTTSVAAVGTLNFVQDALLTGQVTNDGTLNLLGTSNYSAVVSLTGSGVTNFSGHAVIVSRSGSGTLNLALDSRINNLTQTGTISIAGTQDLEVYEGNFAGDLVGAGNFLKLTGSTLTLSGDNSGLSGNMEVASGVLRAESIDALGAGNFVLSGGDLTLVSDVSQIRTNAVQVSADSTITLEAFTPGTLSLTQQLGDLSIGAHTLNVVMGLNFDPVLATPTLGFGNVTLDSAGGTSTFNVDTGARLTTNNVTSFANESLTVDGAGGAGITVIAGTLDLGAGNLTKNGAGTLFVNAVSGTWTGSTTVNTGGGALAFNSAVTLAGQVTNDAVLLFISGFGTTNTLTTGLNGSGVTQFTSEALIGTRDGSGYISFQDNATISTLLGTGTISISPGKTLTVSNGDYSGTLQGSGNLTMSGGFLLRMRGPGAGDYTGTTTVNSGALVFYSSVTLAGQVTNNDYLLFNGGFGTTNTLTTGLDGSGFTGFTGEAVIGTRSGSGDINFQENATIGTLLGTGTIGIWPGKTLDVSSGSFSGTLQGNGGLTKSGPGTLLMNGLAADDYTGTTTVIDGTLQFDSGVTLAGQVTNDYFLNFMASAGVTTLTTGLGGSGWTRFLGAAVIGQRSGSGLLELAGNTTITTLNGTGTVDFSAVPITLQVANGNYAGQFVGASSLDKFSGGTLVLSGFSNSFSGDVNVYNGTIEARSDRALGTGVVRLDGGNLAITGDSAWLLGNNVTQIGSAFVTLGAATVGATAVTQSLGNLGMWNGSSLIVQQNGSFAAGAPATLSVGTVTLDGLSTYFFNVGSGAKLEVRGAVNHTLNNDLIVYGAGDTTITGNLNLGSGSLEKFDSGTLRLLSANTFSGNVDVFGGTLVTASNGLQNVPQIYVHAFGTLNGVNYKTDADLAIDQFGTATFSAAASAITGTIWNNGSLTLNPALGGNSTITLNEFYGSGTTTITRGNLVIYNNALTLGTTVLDPASIDNTLPADLTWGYGAGGGGNNVLNLIGTLTADISGGTVYTTNLFANYIFDVDGLGDFLNGTTGRPLGISGPAMGGSNVYLNVNVSGAATVGRIAVDGTGTVNFAGTAEVVTLENGRVNLTGTLGEFTNVLGGVITSTSADVKITHLTGGSHTFNGQSTTITNFTGGTATLNGVQALVTTFGGTATATATSNITVGTMHGGILTLQGSGPSSFITRLSGGTLSISGSDVLVTVNAGNSPAFGNGADIIGNGSLTKLTVATLNLNTINLAGTTRHQEGVINVGGSNNSLGTVINSSTLNFLNTNGQNSIASLDNNSAGSVNFWANSSIGTLSGSGVLTINDVTKTLTIQSGSFSGTISGSGNLFKSNNGILVLSGTNVANYTGETTINGGTLEFSSAVTLAGAVNNSGSVLRFTSAAGTTTLSSLTTNFGGSTIFTGASNVATVTNANGASLQFNGSTNITGSLNNLSGSYVEINAGGSINLLSGDGVTRINNVGVSINQRFNDGELQVYSSSSINQLAGNGRITLGATLSVNDGATAGTIDGAGSLTKNSGSLLILSGANVDNYFGYTTVNAGSLQFTHDAVTLAGQVSVGGSGFLDFTALTGTTQLNGGLVTYGNTTIGNNASISNTYNNANNLTIVGNLIGSYFENNNVSSTVIGGTASLSQLRNNSGTIAINALAGSSSIGTIQNWGATTIVADLSGNLIQNHAFSTTIGGNATVGTIYTYGGTTSIGGNLISCNYLENSGTTQVFGSASISDLRNNSGTTNIGGNATISDVRTYGGTTSIGGNLINCNYLENNATTQVSGNASVTSLVNYSGSTTIGGTLDAIYVMNYGGNLIVVTGNATITNYLENNGTANFGSASSIWSLWGNGTANFTGASQITNRGGNGTANFADDSSISNVSGNGSLTIASGKTLTISGGSFSGSVSGQGALAKNSASTLTLSGSNVDGYQGSTTVNAGTLVFDTDVTLTGQVTNNQATLLFTSATGTTTLSSLTNNFGGSTIFTGASNVTNVINANGSTLQFNGSTNITGGLDNGTGSYVEINAGGTINTLSGDGLTRINNVGVSINERFDNGQLEVNSSSSINRLFGNGRITLSNATLSVNEGTTAGIIEGNGNLTKNSGSLLVLSGSNVDNYTGNTTVNNGSLQFDHNGVFLAGQVSVGASGTLNFTASTGTTQLDGGLLNSGNTFIGNNAILSDTYNYANNLTIVGNVTGSYFESNGASATTVIGGTALLSHLRNYAGVIDINGLAGSSSIALIQNFAVTNIAGDVSGNDIQNYAGLTIGGNATFGDVRTSSGTTSIGGNLINCNYLENNATTLVSGNASISNLRNYVGTTTIGGNLSANDVVNNGGQLIVVTGTANVTSQFENNGTANFGSTSSIWSLWGTGTANFTGAAQIQWRSGSGTQNFAEDSNIWSLYGDGSVTIAAGKTLTLSTSNFWGSLSGDGSISKITGDTLTLGGSNVDGYLGSTTVNAGTLVFDTDVTLAGQVTNNATLSFNSGSGLTTLTTGLAGSGTTNFAGDASVGALNGTGGATVSIASGKILTVSNGSYAGTLTGGGSLVKANGGTLALTGNGAGNYSGTTSVDAGTLTFTQAVTLAGQVTNNALLNFTNAGNTALTTGLAGTGATNFSGDTSVGTLDGTNTASVSIAGGKVLTVDSGSFAGSLTGGGSLVKSTGGSLTLSGAGAGNYVGTTTVDAGTLDFIQVVTLLGQVTNNSTLNFVGAGTTTLSGGLTGSGTTTFSGNGSITSRSGTGVVNFLGNVSISTVTGSGDLNIASGKSLTIQQGVYSGSITGSGDLVKTTGGSLELFGNASSYGATVVQAGLLTVNSDVTTTGVIVAAGASLGGSGFINGNVFVSGFLAPGNSPGILTVTGTETLANNSSFLAEIGGSTAGSGNNFHDQSNVVGNVVIGTGVDIDLISWNGFTSVARGDTLTLVKATGGIAGRFADTAGSGLTGWTLFDNSSDAAHQFGNLYGTGLSAAQTFGAWGTNANRTAVAGALWTTAVTETTNSATTAGANRVGFIDTNSNAGRAALALVNAGANTDALLDSYSPESFLGLSDYAQMTARTLADGALNQTTSYTVGDWGVGAGYTSVANTYIAGSSRAFDRRLSSNTTYANFSYLLNPRWKASLFFGHNVGSINSAANSTNLNGNVVGLSLNGSVDWHYPVSLKAAITSSSLRFGSNRTMTTATSGDDQIVSGTGTSSAADTKLTDTSAQVSASMLVYTKGRLSLSPTVGLVYGTSKTDAFTETGTGANLAVAGMSSNSTRGVIGLGVGYEVSAELALSMSLGLEKKLNSDADSVSATFAGARDANFSVVGRDTSGNVTSTLGFGLSYRLPEGYSANLNAEFRNASSFDKDKRVNLSINRRF
jgi:autotransporter-associated beta strand protein